VFPAGTLQAEKERKMGNPAGVRAKKKLKRRKKFEARMEGLAYVPKTVREEIKKSAAVRRIGACVKKQAAAKK
jgi:hypothetical protein